MGFEIGTTLLSEKVMPIRLRNRALRKLASAKIGERGRQSPMGKRPRIVSSLVSQGLETKNATPPIRGTINWAVSCFSNSYSRPEIFSQGK